MKKRVLVTGGAGYIGSHLVNLLSQGPYEITTYDNLSTGRKQSVVGGELIVGDLEDHQKLDQLMQEKSFDGVFHFAGSIIVPESVENPVKYYKNNTENTLNLLRLCLKNKLHNFIFSSTAAVYGLPQGGVAIEGMATNPINPYGKTKLMSEWMLEDIAFAHKEFNYIALRYFNVAGANVDGRVGQCSPNSTHLIKIAAETALGKRSKIVIYGEDYNTDDGTCIRDYIHVDDLAAAHIVAMEYLMREKKSHVLNCGYGNGFSVKQVIQVVKEVSGVDFTVEIGSRRAGDAEELVSKADKIKNILGWSPKYNDLRLIVKTALDWEKKL